MCASTFSFPLSSLFLFFIFYFYVLYFSIQFINHSIKVMFYHFLIKQSHRSFAMQVILNFIITHVSLPCTKYASNSTYISFISAAYMAQPQPITGLVWIRYDKPTCQTYIQDIWNGLRTDLISVAHHPTLCIYNLLPR